MSHPNEETLAQLVLGRLPVADGSGVRAHLEECDQCFGRAALLAAATNAPDMAEWDGLSATPATIISSGSDSSVIVLADVERSFSKGIRIGPYLTEEVLGAGGMGVVFRAVHVATGKTVALKTVRAPTPGLYEGLRREISLLKDSRHPGIVEIFDYELMQGDPWYAMELLEGETLAARNRVLWATSSRVGAVAVSHPSGAALQTIDRPPAAAGQFVEVMGLYHRLCAPLAFVHRAGIVHCDLKPANVFLRDRREPVLTDFGLVAWFRGAIERESLLVAGRRRGTLPYISPEVIRGHIPDSRADLYAFGCMLYETLTGRPPFVAWDRDELVRLHLSAQPSRASALVTDLPVEIDDLLDRLLAKKPVDRLAHVDDVERVLAKWVASPVAVRGRSAPPHLLRSRMIGREAELSRAVHHLDRAREGNGVLISVEGESGIGKTFFASEVAQRGALAGFRVVLGECCPLRLGLAGTTAGALHPFGRLFELMADLQRDGESASPMPGLMQHVAVLAPYSSALSSLKQPAEVTTLLPDRAGRERVLDALSRAVEEIAGSQPLLLVIDDVQWADELTLATITELVARFQQQPLFLLLTCRSEEATRTLSDLQAHAQFERVRLERLDRDGVARMTGEMIGMTLPPKELVDFVQARSEGVPFFVAEYLRNTMAEGVLTRRDGAWHLDAGTAEALFAGMTFPVRLAELVRRRLQLVAKPAFAALQQAAVLGREFDASVLALALTMPESTTAQMLAAGVSRQILDKPSDRVWRFTHDKFREVLYADLPAERAQMLHGAAARALETRHAGHSQLDFHMSEIGRHFRAAGENANAIRFLSLAAERARNVSADAEALALFRECIELESSLPERMPTVVRAAWEHGCSDALVGVGRTKESVEALHRGAAILGRPIPTSRLALVLRIAFGLLWRWSGSLFWSKSPDATQRETGREMARVLERLVRSAYFTGEALQLIFGCIASLREAEIVGPCSELTTAYIHSAITLSVIPMHGAARKYLDLAEAALATASDLAVESQLRMTQGVYLGGIGAVSEARACLERGIEVAARIGFHRRRDECVAVRACIELFAGDHQAAIPWIERLDESVTHRRDEQLKAWALAERVHCLILEGKFADAEVLYTRESNVADRAGAPDQVWARGLGAYALYRAGRTDVAVGEGRRAAELAQTIPPIYSYCIHAYERLVELWLSCWLYPTEYLARAEALRFARRACTMLGKAARIYPIARPAAMRLRGELFWHSGREGKAVRFWQIGLAEARRMNLMYQEARLCIVMGTRQQGAHESTRLLARAEAISVALGIPLDRTDERLGSYIPI
jgi:serine/threonine protein kinase